LGRCKAVGDVQLIGPAGQWSMMPPAGGSLRRRALLGAAVCAVAVGRQGNAEPQSGTMLKVVVTGGHPGDPEYGCGGTIARYARLGHQVTILYLNRGEDMQQADAVGCPATDDGVRVREAKEAGRILGATPAFAAQCNGRSVVDNAHYRAFTEQLADLNPDVVFTQWPIDNHPDHRAIFSLTYEAWKSTGRRAAFYFYEVSNGEDTLMFAPSDYVDITDVEPLKRQACYAHASQTPDHFYALQAEVARFRGIEAGYAQAEAFARHIRSRSGLLP
jgi:LmbE family N-acetylglucosaminyl deacetylase